MILYLFCFIPLRFLTDGMVGKQPLCNILYLLRISDSILFQIQIHSIEPEILLSGMSRFRNLVDMIICQCILCRIC